MDNEPVLISVVAANVVGVVINLLLAWGVTISSDQQAAIYSAVQVLCTVIGAFVARSFAWSKSSVDDAVDVASVVAAAKAINEG